MNITIRNAVMDDLKAIQELNYKLFDLEFNNFDPTLNLEWTFSEKGENYFKSVIEKGTVWVALENKKIIGYLAGVECEPSYLTIKMAELDNCYIEKEYRNKGIGNMLLLEFKKYCKNKGIHEIKVTASALNKNAIDFYKNNEFNDYEVTYKMKI